MNNFSQAPAQIKMFNGLQVIDMKDLSPEIISSPVQISNLKKLTDMML